MALTYIIGLTIQIIDFRKWMYKNDFAVLEKVVMEYMMMSGGLTLKINWHLWMLFNIAAKLHLKINLICYLNIATELGMMLKLKLKIN